MPGGRPKGSVSTVEKPPGEVAPKRGPWCRHKYDARIWGQLAGETLEGKFILVRGTGNDPEVFVVERSLCVRKATPSRSTLIKLDMRNKRKRVTGNGY